MKINFFNRLECTILDRTPQNVMDQIGTWRDRFPVYLKRCSSGRKLQHLIQPSSVSISELSLYNLIDADIIQAIVVSYTNLEKTQFELCIRNR